MKSPLNWLGGKSRLAKKIVPLIPDHVCYCEPFCGAAWMLFGKEPSKAEVINDQDKELVTFWRVVQNHHEEFLRFYKYGVVSREIFRLFNKSDPDTLTDIQRAVRFYYLQRLSFGGKTHGRTFGTSTIGLLGVNLIDLEEKLLEVNWRMKRVTIEHLDAVECIERYDRTGTFFYIDHPYWGTTGYGTPFEKPDFLRLEKALRRLKGKFILSLNDTPEVRETFKGFKFRSVTTRYTLAHGREKIARGKQISEVLVANCFEP